MGDINPYQEKPKMKGYLLIEIIGVQIVTIRCLKQVSI